MQDKFGKQEGREADHDHKFGLAGSNQENELGLSGGSCSQSLWGHECWVSIHQAFKVGTSPYKAEERFFFFFFCGFT